MWIHSHMPWWLFLQGIPERFTLPSFHKCWTVLFSMHMLTWIMHMSGFMYQYIVEIVILTPHCCHLLIIYYMKVNMLVAQACQTLVTPWTVIHQSPLSMEIFKQEYWSWESFPFPGALHNSGIKPSLLHSRQILYCLSHQGESIYYIYFICMLFI